MNAFGEIVLDTVKPQALLVPTAKSLSSPPAAPDPAHHDVDHFKCYAIKAARGAIAAGLEVSVADQFTAPAKRYLVKAPARLCVPVDKNGEGIRQAADLVCYKLKLTKGRCALLAPANAGGGCKSERDCGGTRSLTSFCTKQAAFRKVQGVFLANQFGAEQLDAAKQNELCVRSTLTP